VIRGENQLRIEASELQSGDKLPTYSVVELDDMVFRTRDVVGATIAAVVDNNEVEEYVYCFNEPKNHTGIFNGRISLELRRATTTTRRVIVILVV